MRKFWGEPLLVILLLVTMTGISPASSIGATTPPGEAGLDYRASTSFTWGFDNPADYVYDPGLVEVSGGKAKADPFNISWVTKTASLL